MSPEELHAFDWEPDPKVFIFKQEIPGRVKMNTKPLELKDWILIDSTYPDQIRLRNELLESNLEDVFVSQDDQLTQDAKWELFEMVVEYLPERYPKLFSRVPDGILNRVTGYVVSTSKNDGGEDPVIRASRLTQDDWCVMQYDTEIEAYKLVAGVVTFPMRWSLQEKFRKPMASIHEPVIPFTKHLVKQVYSLFRAMRPTAPIWRANWAVFNDLRGPLDLYTPTGHEDRNEVNQQSAYEGEASGYKMVFRAEYQTLRKLPKSGAIVFGIRTYQRYLAEFKTLPLEDAQDLLISMEKMDKDFREYKGAEFWIPAASQYLRDVIAQRKQARNLKIGVSLGAISLILISLFAAKKWLK